jgi:hypothetical protein
MGWKKDKFGHDELEGSNSKNYNCVQYTLAKIKGEAPTKDTPADTATVVNELLKAGYKKVDCSECNCDPGKCRNCAVVYRVKGGDASTVFHAAAFDRQRCDWGGKLSSSGPIVRFPKPEDYLKRLDSEAAANSEYDCYCFEELEEGDYISDEDLHEKSQVQRPGSSGSKVWKTIGLLGGLLLGIAAIQLGKSRMERTGGEESSDEKKFDH